MTAGAGETRAGGSIELRRILPATPEKIFAAWTDPELMRRWMSPVGHAEAEVDLRVGGRFRVTMVGQGITIEHTGEYVEVAPPLRLAFTWQSPLPAPSPAWSRWYSDRPRAERRCC